MAYYLERANRNYMVFERGSSAGRDFIKLPLFILMSVVIV